MWWDVTKMILYIFSLQQKGGTVPGQFLRLNFWLMLSKYLMMVPQGQNGYNWSGVPACSSIRFTVCIYLWKHIQKCFLTAPVLQNVKRGMELQMNYASLYSFRESWCISNLLLIFVVFEWCCQIWFLLTKHCCCFWNRIRALNLEEMVFK